MRRRVVHLPARCSRSSTTSRRRALRLRRGDPAAPPGDRRPVRPRARRAVPHRGDASRRGTTTPARWQVRTDRGDEITCRYYVLAVGILNLHEAAGHPGHGGLRGSLVPHGTLGLRLHRRRPGRAAHRAGRQGRRASSAPARPASSALPPLAEAAKHVYVFQRTPSAIGVRGNRPTDPTFADAAASRAGSRPGWTTSRRSCWAGRSTSTSPTTAGPTTTPPSTTRPAGRA